MAVRDLFYAAAVCGMATCTGCHPRPSPSEPRPGAAVDSAYKPYSDLVRRAIQSYYPQLLTRGVDGSAAYVWLIADGRGRIVGRRMSNVPPKTFRLREAVLERFPDVDVERDAQSVPDAAFATAGSSVHPPPELGPDTVFLFWADRPFSSRNIPPPLGPFVLGRAASEQLSPLRIRRLAAEAAPDDVVWYVYSDENPLIDAGIYRGLRPRQIHPDSIVASIRNMVRARYPDGSLSCSLGTSLPTRTGGFVMTMSVRYEPRKN